MKRSNGKNVLKKELDRNTELIGMKRNPSARLRSENGTINWFFDPSYPNFPVVVRRVIVCLQR
jgi:hypothetical protein